MFPKRSKILRSFRARVAYWAWITFTRSYLVNIRKTIVTSIIAKLTISVTSV